MGKQFNWTSDRVSLLVRKYPTALSLDVLAEELGCNVTAIYNKAHLLRLKRKKKEERYLHHMVKLPPKIVSSKHKQQQIDTIIKNYSTISNSTLSLVTGVSIPTIKKWAHKLGLKKNESMNFRGGKIASMRRYRDKNRDKINARSRRWRERNPDKVREYNRRYRERHREQIAESRHLCYLKRKARDASGVEGMA